jgi:hypothetical protein
MAAVLDHSLREQALTMSESGSLGNSRYGEQNQLRRANMSEVLEQKNGAPTTQEVLTHHLNCFGDIAGTMADYSESRFFTPDELLRASEVIRRFFVRLFEEFAKPGMSFEMLR